MPRYKLRTLLIVLALGPPFLAAFFSEVIQAILIWAIILGAIPGLFVLWYWMLLRSVAMAPDARGKPNYDVPSG
jgi:hypothetical protein